MEVPVCVRRCACACACAGVRVHVRVRVCEPERAGARALCVWFGLSRWEADHLEASVGRPRRAVDVGAVAVEPLVRWESSVERVYHG